MNERPQMIGAGTGPKRPELGACVEHTQAAVGELLDEIARLGSVLAPVLEPESPEAVAEPGPPPTMGCSLRASLAQLDDSVRLATSRVRQIIERQDVA